MEYYNYVEALDTVQRDMTNLIDLYRRYPQNEQLGNYAHKIIRELYQKTVTILDMKRQEEGSLSAEEQQIYESCKKELDNKNLRGLLRIFGWTMISAMIDAYESIYHLLPAGKAEGKVQNLLFKSGGEVLPGYIGFLTTMVDTFETFCVPDIINAGAIFLEASAAGAKEYRVNQEEPDKNFANDMLNFSDYAYTGMAQYRDYKALPLAKIPSELQSVYHPSDGIFNPGHGLRIWLAEKDSQIVVAFSGTDPWNFIMDYEDFTQVFTASPLYLEAAGFLRIMLKTFPNKTFLVCGHSLGGGLAQFSVTANINECQNRVKCYAFNPAGLSLTSLKHLTDQRIKTAIRHIRIYVTAKDKVSLLGAKLGCVVTLPTTEANGHRISDLRKCMHAYIHAAAPENRTASEDKISLDFFTCSSGRLPLWKSALAASSDGSIQYPIFESSITSRQKFMNISFYRELILQMIEHDRGQPSCLGVFEYVNGDSFTVLNRLLLLDENAQTLCLTRESAASAVFFGPYGYGNEKWLSILLNLFSKPDSPIQNGDFDRYLGRLSGEYELTLTAWLYIFKNIYGYDFYEYFDSIPIARQRALSMIRSYAEASGILYQNYDFDRVLLKDEYKQYINQKYTLFSELLDTAENAAVSYGMMTRSAFAAVKDNILMYLRNFINELTI